MIFSDNLSIDTPKILEELKIPGFLNYLHSYYKEHIIDIGQDTKEVENGRVQQLGIKIALFNVTDVENPRVVDDIIVGDSSIHSEVLYEHKSFFFDKKSGVLSIPTSADAESLSEISSSKMFAPDYNRWSGFYIFDLTSSDGFDLKGTVTHSAEDSRYYGISNARSFYIDQVLYAASEVYLKMNFLDNLEEINSIELENTGKFIDYIDNEVIYEVILNE